jgi:hypothetical protein
MKLEIAKQRQKMSRQRSQEMAVKFKQRSLNKDLQLRSACKDLCEDAIFKL